MNEYTYEVTFRHTAGLKLEPQKLSREIKEEEVKARNVQSAVIAITKRYDEVEIIECRIKSAGETGRRRMKD